MKKIILIFVYIIFGVVLLTGCSGDNEPFTEKNYTTEITQIKEININVRDRKIDVSLSEDDKIHINYFENNKEYYDISVSDKNVLTMTEKNDKEWTDYIGSKLSSENRKISLLIPNALLNTLILSTTNEDISVSDLTVLEKICISANGGDIIFGGLEVGNTLDLNVKNGDISGSVVGNYDDYSILSEIKKGESNLPENKGSGEKMLNVSSNNGNVNINFLSKMIN